MRILVTTLLTLLFAFRAEAQDTVIRIAPCMSGNDFTPLGDVNGWTFRRGNDISWSQKNLDVSGWQKIKPSQFSENLTDKDGKLEGWLRLKFILDTSFRDTILELHMNSWAASEVYIDGQLFKTYGNTGASGQPFKEYNPTYKLPTPLTIEKGKEHTLAVHFVDFKSSLPPYKLKSTGRLSYFISIVTPAFKTRISGIQRQSIFFKTIWVVTNIILSLLFWLLAFQKLAEKNILLIAGTTTLFTIGIWFDDYIIIPGISYNEFRILSMISALVLPITAILIVLLVSRIFKQKITKVLRILLGLVFVAGLIQLYNFNSYVILFVVVTALSIIGWYIIASWKTLKGAQWAVLVGILLVTFFGLAMGITGSIRKFDTNNTLYLLLFSGIYFSSPLSLLVYVAMRFNEIIREVRINADEVVRLSEEKKEQAVNQQKVLQQEVDRQTVELRASLENLKATQSQLVQAEKMASLGELTAGIAHEIQNPLNFVTNFSDVNKELIDELNAERLKPNAERSAQLENGILNDIKENEEKINHHGKRADAIVKGMLQHSRTSTGQKELTDINALTDEYLRLAYHGIRAKDKSFNATTKTEFDNSIEKIKVNPQDIGRVILNLINNAFYAVSEKSKQNIEGYEPTVTVATRKIRDKIEINVKDNGNGIPQKILDKIFQPFFTTKPTGQGTGLGLSLAYDIVTKGHGGEIKVITKENDGTEFIVVLPA